MRVTVGIGQLAEDVTDALASPERRRVVLLTGLNVAAALLALGALNVGGALMNGDRQPAVSVPSPELTVPRTPRVRPTPASYVATPDRGILFSPPVLQPTIFASGQGSSNSGAFLPPDRQAANPPLADTPSTATIILPGVAKLVDTGKAAATNASALVPGPLTLTDAMLDAGAIAGNVADVGAAARVSASNAATGGSVSVAAAVSGTTASLGRTVSGIAGALR